MGKRVNSTNLQTSNPALDAIHNTGNEPQTTVREIFNKEKYDTRRKADTQRSSRRTERVRGVQGTRQTDERGAEEKRFPFKQDYFFD